MENVGSANGLFGPSYLALLPTQGKTCIAPPVEKVRLYGGAPENEQPCFTRTTIVMAPKKMIIIATVGSGLDFKMKMNTLKGLGCLRQGVGRRFTLQ